MKTKKVDKVTLFILAAVGLIFPLMADNYILCIGISVLIAALLGQSWNIMSGYAGQFSFGHAVFFGIGAYTSTALYTMGGVSPWIGMIAGALIAALVGVIIGFLSFRYKLRGDYFALATLAFAEIFRIIFNNSKSLGGAAGILIPYLKDPAQFQFASDKTYYLVILAMVGIATAFIAWMSRHKLGLNLVAIKSNQEAAAALGVDVLKYKLIAIAVSAAFAALAGTFYAQYYGFIDPSIVFVATISVEAIVPCIIGGSGTMCGPLLGALIIIPLQEVCNSLFTASSGVNMIIYGLM
ncbi:MAG: branched-chain amino acid ABC transporter permease, partial [Christensenellaceae bacterium]|nr:branched-chain amino acid ABC transporter permease [Christensenellaceae bacterium]